MFWENQLFNTRFYSLLLITNIGTECLRYCFIWNEAQILGYICFAPVVNNWIVFNLLTYTKSSVLLESRLHQFSLSILDKNNWHDIR